MPINPYEPPKEEPRKASDTALWNGWLLGILTAALVLGICGAIWLYANLTYRI